MTINKGFYITREKGDWIAVSPFRRVYCVDLNQAISVLMQ